MPSIRVLCLSALLGSAFASPSIFGLFRNSSVPPTTCTVLRIDPTTGANTTVGNGATSCSLASSVYPAFSTFNSVTNSLVVAIQSAPTLFSYDIDTGAETAGAPLPQNATDEFLGLITTVSTDGKSYATFLFTLSTVYKTTDGKTWTLFAQSNFPVHAAITVDPAAGHEGIAYVADGDSTNIVTVDLEKADISYITSGVDSPWDVQYSAVAGGLLELGSYQFYVTNINTGVSRKVMNIPDGPGYPRVNGISSDGATFFFFDFASVYTIDVASETIATKAPFTWSPRVVGYPIYIS